MKETFPVTGMMCAVCAGTVRKTLADMPGVVEADVNFATQSATVEWNPAETSPDAMVRAVADAGYGLIAESDEARAMAEKDRKDAEEYSAMKRRVIVARVLSLPLAVLCMTHVHFPGEAWVAVASPAFSSVYRPWTRLWPSRLPQVSCSLCSIRSSPPGSLSLDSWPTSTMKGRQ